MTVTTLLFASYADILGHESLQIALAPGSTVRDVLERLRAMPGGERLPPAPIVAVNQAYSRLDRVLGVGDEVAVIPPVAGG
ncbi:MAG: MoaD/ThiS family protein [Gemmatimonadaceae bacterium]